VKSKTNYPALRIYPITYYNKNEEDDLNSSKLSVRSRSSVTSNRNFKMGKSTNQKDKASAVSQKAQIVISVSQSHDSNLNRSKIGKSPKQQELKSKNLNTTKEGNNKKGFNSNNTNKIVNIEVKQNKSIMKSTEKLMKVGNTDSNNNTTTTKVSINPSNPSPKSNNNKNLKFNRKTNSDDISNKNNTTNKLIENNKATKVENTVKKSKSQYFNY